MVDPGMIKGCINFWKSTLFHNQYLLEPSTKVLMEYTVKYLEDYQSIIRNKQEQSEPHIEKGG